MSDNPVLVVDGEYSAFNNDVVMHYAAGDPDAGGDYTLSVKLTHEGIIIDLIDNCADGSEIIESRAWMAEEMVAKLLME